MMWVVDAGKLRHRLRVYDKGTTTRNSVGEEIAAFNSLVAEVWGAVEPLSGREFVEANMVQADVTYRLRIRYRADVRPEMRVMHGTHTYHIDAVLDQRSERRELFLMCHEVLE